MTELKLPHDHGQKIEQELSCMPGTEDFQAIANVFKQLGVVVKCVKDSWTVDDETLAKLLK